MRDFFLFYKIFCGIFMWLNRITLLYEGLRKILIKINIFRKKWGIVNDLMISYFFFLIIGIEIENNVFDSKIFL